MEKKKIQDQQSLTVEYYSDRWPSLFPESVQKQHKNRVEGSFFGPSGVHSSCEQVVTALRLLYAPSITPLGGVSLC